jgi:flagellar hook-associated protein 3 FlgL
MSGPLSLRFSTQAQVDVRRITNELVKLQAQMASGAKANDLQGFGGGSSRLLNAQSLKSNADARASVINELQARFGVQGAALGQVADAAGALALSIREAISANDGRGIATELDLSFTSIVSALNESWNGQPLFAGERQGAGPIRVNTLQQLQDATGPEAIFDEAARHQIIDLGTGSPVKVSAKASELSTGLFDTLRAMKDMLDANGGAIGQPISATQRDQLIMFADTLEAEANNFTNEQGRAGQLQNRFETESVRLEERSNLIVKEIGEQADADIAQVSIQISALLVQYEAAAKTFADLSRLTLLDYL